MTVADEQLAESPPPPLPDRRPSLNPFSWGATAEEPEGTIPPPSTSPEAAEGQPLEPADLSPGEDGWGSDEDSEFDESSGTSSPASFADSKPAQLLSKTQLRKTAEQAVKIGSGMAHTVAAKTDEARAVGLYLADDDDAKAIGHPLADIMHRRGDVVGGKLSPDANSALQAFLGLAGYLTKQVTKVAEIRQYQQGQQQGQAL